MKVIEQHIEYKRTGRYYTFGNPNTATNVIVALHGYGQLPAYFIRKFNSLNPENYLVICPEGPHRFYNAGTSGRVGASWMTKEDRLNDITDYIRFLNEIWELINVKYTFEFATLIGFSQGGATASRWLAKGNATFDKFILWAAVFPPDMEESYTSHFKKTSNFFVIGDQDEYSSIEKAKEHVNSINERGVHFDFVTFNGTHTLNTEALIKILDHEKLH